MYPRYMRAGYSCSCTYARSLYTLAVCTCAPSENIAGDTHLASQNNYGKLEQVLYGQLATLSFRAARVWFRDYSNVGSSAFLPILPIPVRLSSSAECIRRRRVTGAETSSLCVRSACCWEESCCSSTGSSTLLSWQASMAKRYYICCLEPLLACILMCIHAALARVSRSKAIVLT